MIYSHLQCNKDACDYLITKCDSAISQVFFGIFRITRCGKVILLQSATEFYYKVRQVLQSVTDCYYKARQVLQSVTVITKLDVTPEVFYKNRCSQKFRKIHRKTPVPKSLF